jgi:type IV pilus assembly protein PilQ
MNIDVDQIDDNGFVTLSLAPEVSSLSGRTFTDQFGGTALLLQQRRLETGKVRLRDGQTMVLTGIIQDQDRVSISKVPILGDIPLLGRLFRRETNSRQRSELVVLITPQIVDDSDQSTFGYRFTPGEESQKILKP